MSELDQARAIRKCLGSSLDNAVGIDDSDIVNSEGLRYEDEFVKHKLLDAIGDLYLLGLARGRRLRGLHVGPRPEQQARAGPAALHGRLDAGRSLRRRRTAPRYERLTSSARTAPTSTWAVSSRRYTRCHERSYACRSESPRATLTSVRPTWRCSTTPSPASTEGQFVLRIEDTDRVRSTEWAETAILEALRWTGTRLGRGPRWSAGPHGPYRQSERIDLYREQRRHPVAHGSRLPLFLHAGASGRVAPRPAGERRDTPLRRPLPRAESDRGQRAGGAGRGPCSSPGCSRDGHVPIRRWLEGRDRDSLGADRYAGAGQVRRLPHLPPGGGRRRSPDGDQPRPARRGVDQFDAQASACSTTASAGKCPPTTISRCCATPTAAKLSKRRNPTGLDYYRRSGPTCRRRC